MTKLTQQIAKEIKDYFKPMSKTNNLLLSIRTDYRHISVNVMRFNEPIEKEGIIYHHVNQWGISESENLTNSGKALFNMIMQIINKYHYDKSDAMTDYFDTNFYIDLEVGKWDRPFEIKVNR